MKSIPPETSDSRPFDLFSNKLLCLGLLLLVVTGLVRLGSGWSRSQDTAADNAPGHLALHGIDSAQHPEAVRPFQSQRRVREAAPTDSAAATSPTARIGPNLKDAEALRRLEEVVAAGSAREQQTAAALKRFIATGAMAELRNLDRRDVEALAELLAGQLSREELGSVLERALRLPAGQVLAQEDPKATLVGIYDAIAGNHAKEVRPSALMITDQTLADGRVTGRTHVLPTGTQKVYAVFENDRALQGLDQVLAVWRDPNDDRMVFTEFEPVRRGSAYNYVWLEVDAGWPEGRYQVELFHPEAQSLLLASESFSVR